ncbi:MAG: DUF3617 domain-containing protein, partial [Stenotrophobium sp.]
VAACALLPLSASAAGLKAGQWEVTTTMDMGKHAPKMPQLTPEQMTQMKQMGMKMPSFSGGAITTKICVSPEEAASGQPPIHQSEDSGCKPKDFKHSGNHTTGEIVCDGEMKGTGEVDVTQGDETYTSKFHFKGISHGQPVDMNNTSTGHWLQASCK